jgi:hypothetical protein
MSEQDDPVPPEMRAVIDLFLGELSRVSFPDVDAAALQREVEVLRVRATEVIRAREALAVAESALAQRTAVLGELAARGLAYARIYAAAHPERPKLAQTLATLGADEPPAPTSPTPARRRGRPPRQPRAELPFERGEEGQVC